MRTIIKTFLLFLLPAVSLAQAEMTAEQLKKELAAHPQQDTIRVNLLLNKNGVMGFTIAERKEMAAEALLISRKIGYRRGVGFALANLGFFKAAVGNKNEGDSLLRIAESYAKELDDPEVMGLVLLRVGTLATIEEDSNGINYLIKAEQFFEKSGNYRLLTLCRNSIAEVYLQTLSNFPLAMEYFLKAIQSAEKANSHLLLSDSYMGMGAIYTLLGDHNNALVWLKKAESEMNKSSRNNFLYSNLQNSLGEAYRHSGKYPEAIDAYKQAMNLLDLRNANKVTLRNAAINESNLADTYLRMDSLSLAFHYAFNSLTYIKQEGENSFLGWVYGILGRAYLKKAMPDSAIYYAKQGLDNSIKVGTIEFMRDNAEALANAYAFKKDFRNAYSFHLQYVNYKDSMLNTEVKNKTALLQYNNDMGKKEAQISELNQQKKAQRSFLISALIVLTLILITAGLLLRNNRQKQKANKLLQKQKDEIDSKAGELAAQKEILQQSYSNVELLGEIGRKITSSLSLETIISTVYDHVNSLMDAFVFGIGIYHEDVKQLEFPATYEHGIALPAYSNSVDDQKRFSALCFTSGEEIVMGDLQNEYQKYLQQVPVPMQGKQPVSLIYLPLKVKDKILGVITVQSFQKNAYSDYHLYMLRTIAIYAAIALENAESYKKLNQTVDSLQKTQRQLIQSEKMASLGELTAGIAHEIQNPLNFVNNFSEVNTELIDELKSELATGNTKQAIEIANDIKENEQKISHHGRRADAIVKGMLQHSRNNSGQKESTDINALADEYLRLAYHGLRAKDNSFNATIKTDYDDSIGNLNIVSQDMGRVILNLITNAFYAVNEKNKKLNGEYEPTVTVATKKANGKVQISVKDNGTGIPKKAVDKIFQPFFSTKPTGEGTGLGLSITYDIVKAHGGELKVESSEGEGAEFIIHLPIEVPAKVNI